MALRIVAIAEVEEPVQHHHEGEEPAPEKHQLKEPPLVQLHGGNDADDDGRRHAKRQLAIELLDAIGAHQRGVGAIADIGRDCVRSRGRLGAVNSVG